MSEALRLGHAALGDVRDALAERIREGLRRDGQEIRALPAWLPRPRPGLEGTAVVVDTGGTNMRSALVSLGGEDGPAVLRGPFGEAVPTGRDGRVVSGREFFDAQADLVARLAPPEGAPVGYCFSYPAEITADADARLLGWTKGVDIPDVVGSLVGHGLLEGIRRTGLVPGGVRVLNDTVAALLAGAAEGLADRFDEYVGLICGTGTNMAGVFPVEAIPKVAGRAWVHPHMAVNLESGNFAPPHLTAWDDEVDAASDPVGRQRFEKAVSGYYLPFLFARVCPEEPGFDPREGSARLVQLRAGAGTPRGAEVADAILGRSADLTAAALAAVIAVYATHGRVGIAAEGSLFWGDPDYRPRVERTLAALLGGSAEFTILRIPDANLVGTACAALL